MTEMGKYIYGVINGHYVIGLKEPFDLISTEEEKSETEGVCAIFYQDITAVVSDSPIVDYTHMLKDDVARLLVKHQRVIERIMNIEYTIIPMRLGTFAVNEAEVKDILHKGYNLIKGIMEKITNKIEIDVCATWSDFSSVLKEVGEKKEIKEAKDRLLASQGIRVEDQIKVGMMVKEALNKSREMYASKIQNRLEAISQDFKTHELMDEKMVVNAAFLINKREQKDFEKKIEELNAEFNERLNFRCIGPLPLYSFYTLMVKKMQFEKIDLARKRLGLGDFASKDEIKKAYQRAGASTHPDVNLAPGIEREFDEANKAYKILVEYCQACDQRACVERYLFNEEELKKNAILVKVRD